MLNDRPRQPMVQSPTVLAKWPAEVLDEGFCPYPKRLIRAAPKLLSAPTAMQQMATLLSIVDFKRPGGRPPSLGVLAYTAGLDTEAFKARLRELKDLQLIEVQGNEHALEISLFGLTRAVMEKSSEGAAQDL